MDYTRLTLAEVRSALDDVARDARATFADLDPSLLNWRPDASRWSVAQCFEHLITSNRFVLRAADEALEGRAPALWRLLPFLPALMGPALIRSQAPGTTRKYKTPRKTQPTTSDVSGDVIERFVEQNRDIVQWTTAFDEDKAARAIMVSPFIPLVAYSVLDACRLLVAHDHRHIEQARRVLASAPRGSSLRSG
jgi:hypothetical protein